jgi:hypothetical protein
MSVSQRRRLLFSSCSNAGSSATVRAAVRVAEPDLDPLDHVVRERVAELVGVHVRLAGRGHEVGQQALDDPVLADDALGPLDPVSVRSPPYCSPRSTSPSVSSRRGISPTRRADAEHLRDPGGDRRRAVRIGLVLDQEGQGVDRLKGYSSTECP